MIISSDFDIKEKEIIVSYYSKDGDIDILKKKLHDSDMFNWSKSQSPSEHRNWDNTFLAPIPSKFVSRFRLEELISDRFSTEEKNKVYGDFNPKKYYLDIEIQLLDTSFPHPEEARMPVNLITVVNPGNMSYVLSTMKKFDPIEIKRMEDETNEYFKDVNKGEKFKISYIFFETEEEMMKTFFFKVLPKIPFLTGWNVIGFDWLYLVNRAKNIGFDPMEKMFGKLIGNAKMPTHFGLIDYMEVFKNIRPIKVVENHKLDYIANLVLGVSKLKTSYTSMFEAQKDSYNFVKYNIIDTILVKLMEDKLDLLSVVFSISKVARIDVSRVFSNVFLTETLMCREFLKRGRKMANEKRTILEDSTYDGAFVMPPVPGHYKYVACYDFASMYPNIQIQFNISPDSYLGKGETSNPNEIYTKNNTRFTNKYNSAAREILTGLYNERKSIKFTIKKLKELVKEKQNNVELAKTTV